VSLGELYREVIMDHSHHPRNRRRIEDADVTIGLDNPSCGDEIVLDLTVEGGVIRDVAYEGEGCTISMAAASMMTEATRGMTLGEAKDLIERYKAMLMGHDGETDDLGELAFLKGVTQFPMRVKCAVLAFTALEKGIHEIEGESDHGQA